jgi:hypothetical protein
MLRLICGQLADREDYFALAVRMNCSISLSITKNIILHFNENWTTDDKWQFWCEYHGLIIPFGTMEHIIKISNGDAHPSNPIPETCLADLIRNSRDSPEAIDYIATLSVAWPPINLGGESHI